MGEFQLGQKGLQLAAPTAGDIVSVRLKPCPRRNFDLASALFGGTLQSHVEDESKNPQHYRHTNIWRVVAANGGHAVVEALMSYDKGRREVWPIDAHDWFDASELFEALDPPEGEKP